MEQTITEWISNYGIVAIFFLMIINGSLSAPPSEVVLSCAGILVARGIVPLQYAVLSAVAGNWIGALILYFVGKKYGETTILSARSWLKKLPTGINLLAEILPSKRTIHRYSERCQTTVPWWLFYCRCIPVIRSVISIPAGISKISFGIFSVLTTLGASLWALVWIVLGYLAEKQTSTTKPIAYLLLILSGGLLLFLLKAFHKYMTNKRIQLIGRSAPER